MIIAFMLPETTGAVSRQLKIPIVHLFPHPAKMNHPAHKIRITGHNSAASRRDFYTGP